jgi:hypothetical protein
LQAQSLHVIGIDIIILYRRLYTITIHIKRIIMIHMVLMLLVLIDIMVMGITITTAIGITITTAIIGIKALGGENGTS